MRFLLQPSKVSASQAEVERGRLGIQGGMRMPLRQRFSTWSSASCSGSCATARHAEQAAAKLARLCASSFSATLQSRSAGRESNAGGSSASAFTTSFFGTGAAREFSDGARFRCRVRYQKVWLKNKQGTNTIVRTGGRKKVIKVLLAGDTRVKPASFVSLNQSRLRRAAPPALALSTRSSEASRNLQLWSIICLGLGLGLGWLELGLGSG